MLDSFLYLLCSNYAGIIGIGLIVIKKGNKVGFLKIVIYNFTCDEFT